MGTELVGKEALGSQTSSSQQVGALTAGKQTLVPPDAIQPQPLALSPTTGGVFDGSRTINALAGTTAGTNVGGDLFGDEPGLQLLEGLRAIKRSPTEGTATAQATLRASWYQGTSLARELYYVFLNFKKVCTGEEARALGWFKSNMTHARGVISGGNYNLAIAMANAAAEANPSRKSFGDGVVQQPRQVTQAEARKLVDGVMAGDRQITAAADALKRAGFTAGAVDNARTMMKRYTALRYTPAGSAERLHQWLDELERCLKVAQRQRTIGASRGAAVHKFATEFRAEYPLRTPEQRQADSQQVQDGIEAVIARGQDLLDGLYILRASLEKRNGFTFNGTIKAQAALILIRKRLPELERAIGNRDRDAIERVLRTDPVPWCIERGGPKQLADDLLEIHKAGVWQLELVNDIVGVTPVGPVTKILFGACVEGLKYAANEQSGAETVVNIAFSVAAPYLDNLVGGAAVRNAFLGALRGGLESFAKDFVKIVMMPDKTRSEKIALIENAGKKAILGAFVAAVTGRVKALSANMDPGKKRDLVSSILDAAGKFGLDRPLKPELDKFLQ